MDNPVPDFHTNKKRKATTLHGNGEQIRFDAVIGDNVVGGNRSKCVFEQLVLSTFPFSFFRSDF